MNILCACTQAQRVLLPALGIAIPQSTEQPPCPPLSPTALQLQFAGCSLLPQLVLPDLEWSEEAKTTLRGVHRAKSPFPWAAPTAGSPYCWHWLHAARKTRSCFPFVLVLGF